jgi:hypothetical protein
MSLCIDLVIICCSVGNPLKSSEYRCGTNRKQQPANEYCLLLSLANPIYRNCFTKYHGPVHSPHKNGTRFPCSVENVITACLYSRLTFAGTFPKQSFQILWHENQSPFTHTANVFNWKWLRLCYRTHAPGRFSEHTAAICPLFESLCKPLNCTQFRMESCAISTVFHSFQLNYRCLN